MRLLHGLRTDGGFWDPVVFPLKFYRIGGPNFFKGLDQFIGALAALLPYRASGLVFVLRPSDAKSDFESSAGQDIQRRQLAREQDWVIPGKVEYAGAQCSAACVCGSERQRLQRVQHTLVLDRKRAVTDGIRLPWVNRPKYPVEDPKAVEAQIFGSFGDGNQRLRSDSRAHLWKCKSETHRNLLTISAIHAKDCLTLLPYTMLSNVDSCCAGLVWANHAH